MGGWGGSGRPTVCDSEYSHVRTVMQRRQHRVALGRQKFVPTPVPAHRRLDIVWGFPNSEILMEAEYHQKSPEKANLRTEKKANLRTEKETPLGSHFGPPNGTPERPEVAGTHVLIIPFGGVPFGGPKWDPGEGAVSGCDRV